MQGRLAQRAVAGGLRLLLPSVVSQFELRPPEFPVCHGGAVKQERCYLIGDPAGLASVDLSEGIGPAVENRKEAITPVCFGGLTQKVLKRVIGPKPVKPAPQV